MADDQRPWGRLHGRMYVGVGDSLDAGQAPDKIGVSGTATFTATVDSVVVGSGATREFILPQSIDASIVDGALQWQGTDDVSLIANLDAQGKSAGWQWKVDFKNLTYLDPNSLNPSTPKRVTRSSYNFDVRLFDNNAALVNGVNPTITDWTEQAPVLTPSATQIAKGEKGDTGGFGVNFLGPWSSSAAYSVRDAVNFAGSSYVAVTGSTNDQPPSANWALLASKGDPGTVTGGYQPPVGGIPKTDLATVVQSSLGKADSATQGGYVKPGSGIPSTDLAAAAQTSLGKADSAYQKPGTGIAKTDMATAVQTSLGKADTSVQQTAQVRKAYGTDDAGAAAILSYSRTPFADSLALRTSDSSVQATTLADGATNANDSDLVNRGFLHSYVAASTTDTTHISDATSLGKSLVTAADAQAARVVTGAFTVVILSATDPLPTNPAANTLVIRTS